MFFFLIVLLIIAIFLEGTVTNLPLVLVYLMCLAIWKRDSVVFIIAFAAGLLLDVLSVRLVGVSSLFFTVFVFLILLYQRKYEINSYPFVGFAAFFGSIVFMIVFAKHSVIIDSLISSVVAVFAFASMKFFHTKQGVHITKVNL